MTLRTRTLATMAAALVVLVVVVYAATHAIMLVTVRAREDLVMRRDMGRAQQALSREMDRLSSTAADWAYWDDTYTFVATGDPAYIEDNLQDASLGNLGLSLIAFTDAAGQVVYAKAIDLQTGEEVPLPAGIEEQISSAGALSALESVDSGLAGVLLLGGEPYLAAVRPILTSASLGPVRGALLMARAFDAPFLEELSATTQLAVTAYPAGGTNLPEDFAAARMVLSVEEPTYVTPLTEDTKAGYTLLPDLQGRPSLILSVHEPREEYDLGRNSLLQVSLMLVLAGTVLGGVSLLALEKTVLSRLKRLSASVQAVGASGDTAARIQQEGEDEIGGLTIAINGMLARVQSSQQEIRESEERFRAVFENAQDMIFIKDLQLRYTHVNPAMGNLFGLTALDLHGQDDVSIWGEETSRGIQEVDRRVLEGNVVDEEVVRTIRGVTHTFHLVKVPMRNTAGEIAGLCGVARDITERSRAQRLREAVYRVSQAASTVRDLDELYRSAHAIVSELMPAQNLYIALYDPAAETISFPYFVDQVDDRPQPRGKGGGLTEYVLRTGKPLLASPEVFEDLMLRGEVEDVGAPSVDWLGVPLQAGQKVLGVLAVQSYTQSVRYREDDKEVLSFVAGQVAMAIESKRAEEAQRQGEERFRFLVESLGEGVAIVDIHDRFTFANPAAGLILGVDPGWLLGRSLGEFTSMQQFYGLQEQVQRRRAGERSTYELEILRPDGEKHSVVLTVTPRLGTNGEVTGYIGVFRDVTEEKRAEQRLRDLSTHDALTGLYNRAYFEEEMARLERGRVFPVSAVGSDVDDLKVVNDRDGHAAGDDLLRRAAAVLQGAFRSEDVVARIGGDEFAVLLPGADASAAERALVRVRKGLKHHNERYPGKPLSLSLGSATGERGCLMASLLQEADAMMYLDKQQKVVASSSPPEAP